MLTIKNLSKEFHIGDKRQLVLNDINLKIGSNEFITIMGPSGGGKSTLLQIIAMITEPTTGSIIYDGEEIDLKKEKVISKIKANDIGLVFQNSNLISSLSPVENLIIAMNSKESYKAKAKKAKELLDKVGLKDKYNSNVMSLSGGEAQRVAIVRALVNNPKLILCDEPTGALDTKNTLNIIEMLMDIKREKECTIIIVTHDSSIGKLGERKIFLEEGEIHEVARSI